ncbi:MAG: tetratricopeptide repeat protein [Deltaproteobacteria bacterium]|nr:MAG: tetratricopeptide repeat protein [Deltaproteobacteria bacterium]
MEMQLEEEFKPGDLEGLVLDKFLVDAFKPKLCDEKDIVVVAFLVKQRDPARDLSNYITQGQFDLVDVEVSSSPGEDGNYTILVELNRNQDMFDIMDNLLNHITHLVNVTQWYFKPFDFDDFIVWNRENFVNTVPQNLESYFGNQEEHIDEGETVSAHLGTPASGFDYQLLGEIIENQVTKSSRAYIKAFQKQFKVIIKDSRSMLQHIADLKSDHQYLHQQLELYEQREKMALLREQQDFKRIRALEHKISLIAPHDAEKPEIVIPQSSVPITVKSPDFSDTPSEPEVKENTESDDRKREETPTTTEEPASRTSSSGVDVSQETVSGFAEKAEEKFVSEPIVTDTGSSVEETSKSEAPLIDAGGAVEEKLEDSEQPTDQEKDAGRVPSLPTDVEEIKQQAAISATETDSLQRKEAVDVDEDRPTDTEPDSSARKKLVKKLIAQGLAAVKQKEYHKAIEYFTQVTELMPNARRSLLRIAVLFYRLKDYEAAYEYAQRALELGAESAKRILAKIKDKQAMISDESISEDSYESPTEEAIIWGPDDFDASVDTEGSSSGEGTDAADSQDVIIFGQPVEAKKAADHQASPLEEKEDLTSPQDEPPSTVTVAYDFEAIQFLQAPQQPKAGPESLAGSDNAKEYFSLGLKAFKQKKYHEAIDYFTKVTELLPNARRSFIRLAALYYRLKDYETAQTHARKALDLGSRSAERILEKIEAKRSADSGKKPPTEMDDTSREPPTPDRSEDIGYPEEAREQAVIDAERANRLNENAKGPQAKPTVSASVSDTKSYPEGGDAKKYFTLGVKAFERNEYQKAIENFSRVTELLPNAPRSFFRLAVLHYRLKDYEKARGYAQQALDLGSDDARRILEKIANKRATSSDASGPGEITDTLPEFPTLDIQKTNQMVTAIPTKSANEQDGKVSEAPGETMTDADQSDLQDSKFLEMESATETISMEDDTLIYSNNSQSPAPDTEIFPKSDPVSDYFALGLAAAEQESYHKAIQNFTKVTELLPDAPASYLNLANLYLKLKDYEQAKENAKRAFDLGSESAKRILEKVEAELWTASAVSAANSEESRANESIVTNG